MKANEAPENIYIQPDAQDGWFMVNNLNNTLVEYTRTDAFIEKACEWLEQTLSPYIPYCNIDIDLAIEDFKKYMKRE